MNRTVNFHDLKELSPDARAKLMMRAETDLAPFIAKVAPILDAVRCDGDEAVARFTRQFDNAPVTAESLAATPQDFDNAERALDLAVKDALAFAADSIRRFHAAQMPEKSWTMEVRPGVLAGDRVSAIPSVACYVPRGKGSFPSAVLMTAIPATVADVRDVVIITPPGPGGAFDDATLVAARMAGVARVYKAGGAQGIAAVAYGTQTIPRVSKIVGPGSPWVAAAKRLVSHTVDVGTPAGPSESIIMADDSVDGRLAALDLLIESEHGPDSSAYIITWSPRVATEALAALTEFYGHMSPLRRDYASAVLSGPSGGVILARDAEDAIAFVNDYAPEHLQILSAIPEAYVDRIEHAGEILLGIHTPSTLGNYVIGANHVLPTGGWAKTGSALSVHDFLKRTSIVKVSAEGYRSLAPHAHVLATYEGFDGHARAVSKQRDDILRKNDDGKTD
jgi:histidinol dehydrogenase